jgi:membrane protein YqaA with SNARE-associated domain
MKELLETLIEWGVTGVFVAALLDGAGVPVPSGVDVLLVLLAKQLPDKAASLAAMAVVGSTLGNLFLFWLARRGGQKYLDKKSAGKRSRRFRAWFDRYGLLTVFVSALVPLPIMPMKIFVLCAGALGSTVRAFLMSFVGARIARYAGLAYLGQSMGEDAIGYLRQNAWYLAAFAAALFLVLYLLIRFADRRQRTA